MDNKILKNKSKLILVERSRYDKGINWPKK